MAVKLISWNLNGIRAVAKKGLVDILTNLDADAYCFQETKAQDDQVSEALVGLQGYHLYSNSAEKKGYSGTAVLTKQKPLNVQKGIGIDEFDDEGRVLTLEFEKYFLVTSYVPNSQSELARLAYRQKWDEALLDYLKDLEQCKPVVLCGDLNVAHQAMDLKNPKSNYNKTAGYTQQEIDGMTNYINAGFVDTFRHFNPEEIKYSWWSYRFSARAKNIGWRIDYFLISKALIDVSSDAVILNEVMGSDHCPVGLTLDV